jgi:hypothetical protein
MCQLELHRQLLLLLQLLLFGLQYPPTSVAAGPANSDLAAVHGSILRQLTPAAPDAQLDAEVANISRTLGSSGVWADVAYADGGRSWWGASEHLRRSLLMASALASPHSAHKGSAAVRASAELAVGWWLRRDPQNSNWWWMQIGVPRVVTKCLLLLGQADAPRAAARLQLARPLLRRTPLYDCQHANASSGGAGCACIENCHYMNTRPGVFWTGCNRVWASSLHILLGALSHGR